MKRNGKKEEKKKKKKSKLSNIVQHNKCKLLGRSKNDNMVKNVTNKKLHAIGIRQFQIKQSGTL